MEGETSKKATTTRGCVMKETKNMRMGIHLIVPHIRVERKYCPKRTLTMKQLLSFMAIIFFDNNEKFKTGLAKKRGVSRFHILMVSRLSHD